MTVAIVLERDDLRYIQEGELNVIPFSPLGIDLCLFSVVSIALIVFINSIFSYLLKGLCQHPVD